MWTLQLSPNTPFILQFYCSCNFFFFRAINFLAQHNLWYFQKWTTFIVADNSMYHPRNISAIKKYTVWIPACFNCQNVSHISPSYSWQMLRYNKPASINIKIMVFWDMRFKLYYRYQCFREASCLHFQDKNSLLPWKRRKKV